MTYIAPSATRCLSLKNNISLFDPFSELMSSFFLGENEAIGEATREFLFPALDRGLRTDDGNFRLSISLIIESMRATLFSFVRVFVGAVAGLEVSTEFKGGLELFSTIDP